MHWDQNIIFIIIAAIIGISRLVSRISEESKKQSQRRRQAPQGPPPQPGTWIEQAQTAAGTKMSIARTDDQPSVRASTDTIWKQALRSPSAARTAIILREIFGPPRGVQSSNFVFERI